MKKILIAVSAFAFIASVSGMARAEGEGSTEKTEKTEKAPGKTKKSVKKTDKASDGTTATTEKSTETKK